MDKINIHFSTVDEKQTPAKIIKSVEKLLKKYQVDVASIDCSKEKSDRNRLLSIESSDFTEEVLQECLNLLRKLPRDNEPYAKYWHEQAGEFSYLSLLDGALHGFDDKESLTGFFTSNPYHSIEYQFYQAFADSPCRLFLRLAIKAKGTRNSLLKVAKQYIHSKSDEDYKALNDFIDTAINKKKGHKIEFPFYNKSEHSQHTTVPYYACELVAKSLCFAEVEGDYLYLGYHGDELQQCFFEQHLGSAIPDLLSKLGHSITGKIDTPDLSKNNKQLLIFFTDCCNIYEGDKCHINLWPA